MSADMLELHDKKFDHSLRSRIFAQQSPLEEMASPKQGVVCSSVGTIQRRACHVSTVLGCKFPFGDGAYMPVTYSIHLPPPPIPGKVRRTSAALSFPFFASSVRGGGGSGYSARPSNIFSRIETKEERLSVLDPRISTFRSTRNSWCLFRRQENSILSAMENVTTP